MLKKTALLAVIVAATIVSAAVEATESRVIRIPPGELAPALESLAKQTGLQLVFQSEQLKGLRTQGISGDLSPEEAVATLLNGTSLTFSTYPTGAILISAPAAETAVNTESQSYPGGKSLSLAQADQSGTEEKTENADAGRDTDASEPRIQEIVVTAQKRAESLQEVPFSVNALSGEDLAKNNVTDFVNLENYVPGLEINETSGNGTDFSIRGIPNGGTFLGLPSVMDVYWNGTVIPPEMALGAMFDMDRVEVLRGPQGSLQGRPAPAGAVMLYSRQPNVQLGHSEGRVRSKVRDDGGFEIEGGVSLPLMADTLAIRLAGLYGHDDGRVPEFVNANGLGPKRENWSTRLTALWEPSEDFRASLVSQYSDRREDNVMSYVTGNGVYGYVSPYENRRNGSSFETYGRRFAQHTLQLDWDVAHHRVTSLTGYGLLNSDWDLDGDLQNPAVVLEGYIDRDRKQLVQELRLASTDSGFWEYMVGLYYLRTELNNPFLLASINGQPVNSFTPASDWQRQLGVFTFHKFNLTDKWTWQGGLRYQRYRDWRNTTNVENEQDAPSWSTQLSYDFRKDVMGYVSYQRGFRPASSIAHSRNAAQIAAQVQIPVSFFAYKEETSDAVELGLKSIVLDGRLRLNVNLYRQDFNNFISGARGIPTDVDLNGVFTWINDNVSIDQRSTSYPVNTPILAQGVEFEWQALLTDSWTFSGAAAYNNLEYGDNVQIPCAIFGAGGAPSIPAGQYFATCDVSGTQINEVRKWTGSVSTQYTFKNLSERADGYLRGIYNYRGVLPTPLNNTVGDLGGVGVLDLHIGLASKNGRWDAAVWVENATDKHGLTDFTDGGNFNIYTGTNGFVEERRFGLTVGHNF